MKTALRVLFLVVLASMLWVTTWAGLQCPLFGVPRAVATHPWFIATLFDAYWGFTTFYVWVFWRESSWSSKVAWFLAIFSLDDMAGAPEGGKLSDVLTSRQKGPGWLGIGLAAAGVAVTVAAALATPSAR